MKVWEKMRGVAIAVPFVCLALSLLIFGQAAGAQTSVSGGVIVADMARNIDSGAVRYVERLLDEAEATNAVALVLELDTPGGSLDATRDLVNLLLGAPVPVAVYVAPNGAQAASAGTFVGAAAHILAMAPVSTIGAAAPVDGMGEDLPDTLDAKVREDAAALVRSVAELRNRNAEALEATVQTAAAYSAAEAVELGIADFVANDVEHLLELAHGRTVEVQTRDRVLNTAGAAIRPFSSNFWETFLDFFANPNIAYAFLVLGIVGITIEALFFGIWIPGVFGVISLMIGAVALVQLPFSWLGIGLLALAFVLMVVETQVPGWGVFGAGSIVSLVLGGVFLFNGNEFLGVEGNVNIWILAGIGVLGMLFMGWLVYEVRRARASAADAYKSPLLAVSLVGATAEVIRDLDPDGQVYTNGESWLATLAKGSSALAGSIVKVVKVEGNVLLVEPSDPRGGAPD